jgi:hypothetical protein
VYYLKRGFHHLQEGQRAELLLPAPDGPGGRQAEDGLGVRIPSHSVHPFRSNGLAR